MKIRLLILLLLAGLLAVAAYYYYQHNSSRSGTDVWSFVPENALLVYETTRLPEIWKNLPEQPAGESISGLPGFARLQQNWARLDSAAAGRLNLFLQERPVYTSLHITGKSSFDYLFYLPAAQGGG